MPLPLLFTAVLLALSLSLPARAVDDIALPDLGDAGGSLISIDQEYRLGRAWLRMYRASVPTHDDPVMQDYLEQLISELSVHSQLRDHRLMPVLVKNPVLNAFAVPGGVMGVHTGLFTYAETEEELAAVIAHELAHLSQHHFARGVEESRANTLPTLAGMLAGVLLAAAGSAEAGMAAITATQAGALQQRLRYSRQYEQEADRIGMQTLVAAELDPRAVPAMFERMQQSMRYQGNRIPEFLLTHPVTETRISDARTRAAQYPARAARPSLNFELMKARAIVSFADNPNTAIQRFNDALINGKGNPKALRYGLALAQIEAGQHSAAQQNLDQLLKDSPHFIPFIAARAQAYGAAGDHRSAAELLKRELRLSPHNYPLSVAYANALRQLKQPEQAEKVINEQVRRRPEDPALWYQLAETRGLAGNILGVHEARAEYFILTGRLTQAETQLGYALKLASRDFTDSERLRTRLKDIAEMKNEKL